ncbi:hypothetical protein [Zunongwangia pacifica]|uniref:Uncharacterized protein n=1 Tax=Zunongwangia pacifica TaxID=2911062 RepID=A0A9X1ZTT7_9FLAO|nr:hypothetical protein [Zunongwangia pacifica]MCL6217490.1 hypothetical protein [Zunongwangia pacifica]
MIATKEQLYRSQSGNEENSSWKIEYRLKKQEIRIRKQDEPHPVPIAIGIDPGSHPDNKVMRFRVRPASPAGRHGMTKKL